MTHVQKYLVFEGLRAGIAVTASQAFFNALPTIFSHWPFSIESGAEREVFGTLVEQDTRYAFTSPFMDKSPTYRDPVNAICAIVAELAWARLREDPSLLCLHGAAVEIAGRLVVFPATRRAGKSTLSVALAAAGHRVFTDDFLPLSIAKNGIINGISSGVSPRLRLPMPPQIGKRASQFLSDRQTVSNRQYAYVAPNESESGRFGEAAPIGGIVFLNRRDSSAASLTKIDKAETLKTLIQQNFSRAGNAAGILAMLEFLARNLPAYSLSYDEAEPAIELLAQQFASWPEPLPRFTPKAVLANEFDNGLKPYIAYDNVSTGQFEHAAGVEVVNSGDKRFLTGRNGQSIHYLNEGAAMIWQILDEPTGIEEAVDILCAAFPDLPREQAEADVLRCFSDFGKNGLLNRLEAAPNAPPPAAQIYAKQGG